MPQWPTTNFVWNLETLAGAPVSDDYLFQPDQRNEIVIETAANNSPLLPGQYVLRVDYFNTLLACNGSASKIITISDKTIILPTTNFCVNERIFVETTDPSPNTTWEVYFGNNAPITVQNEEFTQAFANSGTYTIIAQNPGKCKSDPVQVKILRLPSQPTGRVKVVGSETIINPPICPGIPTQLFHENSDPNSYIEWRVVNSADGAIQGNSSGENITVVFEDLSTLPSNNQYEIEIRRVLRDPAACKSSWKRYIFSPISIVNAITPSLPLPVDQSVFCTSSSAEFETSYLDGEFYTWTIVPNNLGSVVSGQGTRNVTVEWNEIPNGYVNDPRDGLSVSIRKCGIELQQNEYPITLVDDPNLRFVNLPTDVCANNEFDISFTSDIAFDSFNSVTTFLYLNGGLVRNFNTSSNGNIITISGGFFNSSLVDFVGDIRLVINDPSGCNGGVLEDTINVKANPLVNLRRTNEPNDYCSSPWTVTLDANVQGNSSNLLFRWYDSNGVLVSSGVGNDMITRNDTDVRGEYTVEVESPNGCISTDEIGIPICAPMPPCPNPVPPLTLSNVVWNSCNEITANASFDPSVVNYSWSIGGANEAAVTPGSNANNGFFFVNEPGEYRIVYQVEYPNGCMDERSETVRVGYQSVLDVNPTCAGNNSYDVQLLNSSLFLLSFQPTSVIYTGRNISTGGAVFNIPGNLTEANLSSLIPGIYEFDLTIDAPNAPPCSLLEPIIIDLRLPDATFTIEDTCTENALTLKPTEDIREGYTYRWEFNGTANENYMVDVVLPQSLDTSVKLIVTDPYGCTVESDILDPDTRIDVNAAAFNGIIDGFGDYCHTDLPILSYKDGSPFIADPDVLQWFAYGDDVLNSSGVPQPLATGPTFSPTGSGSYYARAYDGDGCFVELAPAVVTITQPYVLNIPDQGQICRNSDYFIQANIDASLIDVEYRWTRSLVNNPQTPIEILGWNSNAPIGVLVNESNPEYYNFTLEVRDRLNPTSCVSSFSSSMYVTEPPVTTISVSYNCDPNNPYEVELTASNPSSYVDSFLWSDGQMGETIRVNRGGAYQVTSLSTYYNCPIVANVEVLKHPEEFIWVFPSGCLEICQESNPNEIIGPLPQFHEWSWINEPIGVESGVQSNVQIYDMSNVINNSTNQSSLQLYLENPGGCFVTSKPLLITLNSELCSLSSERNSAATGYLKIVPNPTNGATTITWEDMEITSKNLRIKIYSLQGVLLIDKKVNQQWQGIEFNASDLKTGAYMVRLEDGFNTYLTGQLIKK
jgi:hypothetical protein